MRTLVRIFSSSMTPSDLEITDCPVLEGAPVAESVLERPTGLRIGYFEDPYYFKHERVVGVLGPIACNLCPHQCQDAYSLVWQGQDVLPLIELGIPITETSVEVTILARDGLRLRREQLYNTHPYGWDVACQDAISNDIIDVHRGRALTVAPSGELVVQQAQSELTNLPEWPLGSSLDINQ